MIFSSEYILVLGHRNPDTDASTSAHAYAEFLNRTRAYDAAVVPGILGELPVQSRYVFQRAGVEPPDIVTNLYPRVCHVTNRKVDTLSVNDRFRDAVEMLIRSDHSMLPVLDEEGKLHSIFSHRHDTSRFLFGFDVVPLLGRLLTWADLLEMPGARPVGEAPARNEITGQLRLALDGDPHWRAELRPGDILVCSDLGPLLDIPRERFPGWIVLAGREEDPGARETALANGLGAAIMAYRHSALDFLFQLMSQVRVGQLDMGVGACVGEFDYVHDIKDIVFKSRHAVPVLDSAGKLVGVVSSTDVQATPRTRVILVDHFDSAQAAPGIENAEIIEIVDHHRVGDLQTAGPVRVDCRPLGSSSTIVAIRFFDANLEMGKPLALLLLGGLLADTLCFRSPTTTLADRDVAARLAEKVGVSVEDFGREILRAGDDLLTADPASIWNRDQKTFGIQNHTIAVAQLETVSLDELPAERLERFRDLLAADFAAESHLVSLLFLTDVLSGDSWFAACESPPAAGVSAACFGTVQPRKGWTLAKGIVSRKKQIVPHLLRALAERRL
jgi:manganese-dependent inorganic pyrophosphatase